MAENNDKVKAFEKHLKQKEITPEQYYNDIGQYKIDNALGCFGGAVFGGGVVGTIFGGGILAETLFFWGHRGGFLCPSRGGYCLYTCIWCKRIYTQA